MSSRSAELLCNDLEKAIDDHNLACSSLFGSLGEGPVDSELEATCQTALEAVNRIASQLVELLDPSNRDMIREKFDLLRKHYNEWEVKNASGKNPVNDLTAFDGYFM